MRQIRRKILHKSIDQKGLELLRDLFQDNALILLECVKTQVGLWTLVLGITKNMLVNSAFTRGLGMWRMSNVQKYR